MGTNTKNDRQAQQATKSDRRLLMQAFMHMADISNCTRPWEVYKFAVLNLEEEFFAQGDRERDLGVPILPLMNREKDSLASAQGFWIESFVGPLLTPYCNFISIESRTALQGNAAQNKQKWADLLEKHGRKTAAELLRLESDA